MEHVQLPVIVGVAVSLLIQVVKKAWAAFDCSPATEKQIVAAALAGIGVLAAAGWHLSEQVGLQMVGAALVAWGTHKALLKQPETPSP